MAKFPEIVLPFVIGLVKWNSVQSRVQANPNSGQAYYGSQSNGYIAFPGGSDTWTRTSSSVVVSDFTGWVWVTGTLNQGENAYLHGGCTSNIEVDQGANLRMGKSSKLTCTGTDGVCNNNRFCHIQFFGPGNGIIGDNAEFIGSYSSWFSANVPFEMGDHSSFLLEMNSFFFLPIHTHTIPGKFVIGAWSSAKFGWYSYFNMTGTFVAGNNSTMEFGISSSTNVEGTFHLGNAVKFSIAQRGSVVSNSISNVSFSDHSQVSVGIQGKLDIDGNFLLGESSRLIVGDSAIVSSDSEAEISEFVAEDFVTLTISPGSVLNIAGGAEIARNSSIMLASMSMLSVNGHVTLGATGRLSLDSHSSFEIQASASLTIHPGLNVNIGDHSSLIVVESSLCIVSEDVTIAPYSKVTIGGSSVAPRGVYCLPLPLP